MSHNPSLTLRVTFFNGLLADELVDVSAIRAKLVDVETHLVNDRDIQVGKRVLQRAVAVAIEQSLMPEAATRQNDGKVLSTMHTGA